MSALPDRPSQQVLRLEPETRSYRLHQVSRGVIDRKLEFRNPQHVNVIGISRPSVQSIATDETCRSVLQPLDFIARLPPFWLLLWAGTARSRVQSSYPLGVCGRHPVLEPWDFHILTHLLNRKFPCLDKEIFSMNTLSCRKGGGLNEPLSLHGRIEGS